MKNKIPKEAQLDEEILKLFGKDPSASKALAIKLHSSIYNQWKFWAAESMSKDERENLLTKYLSSSGLDPPKLNPEILVKLPKHSKTRDTFICKRQQSAGSVLAALGSAMIMMIVENESVDRTAFMTRFFHVRKLISDMMHSQTKSRAAFILAGVNKKTRNLLEKTRGISI